MALEINGERIDDAEIRAEAQALRPRLAEMLAEYDPLRAEMQLRELAEARVLERVLLGQEARAYDAAVSQEMLDGAMGRIRENCVTPMNGNTLGEDARAQLRLEALVSHVTRNVPKPKRKDALNYYRAHPEQFESPEMVHAAHIVKNVDETTPELAARESIEELRRRLEQGADFAELANAHSDCPGNGGDLGWFARGQMVAEFEQVVFGLEPREISAVFRTPFGFHIARLLERRPAGKKRFEQVESALLDQLHRAKQHRALDEYVTALRERAEVRRVK